MKRRHYLAGMGAAGIATLSGCGGLFETEAVSEPQVLADRPDAVYVPTHVEGMEMIDMAMADRLRLALSYSYPHRFWLMDGNRTNQVEIEADDSVHLMVTAWDAETGIAIPSSTANLTVRQDGDVVDDRRAWPMLSQNMGFHYGDNVPLAGDGTYEVEVAFGPVSTRAAGAFEGAFDEQMTRTITFEYSQDQRDEITFERLDDRAGERAALDPMDMDMMPVHQLPRAADLPGSPVGQGSIADATIVGTVLETPPDGIDGEGQYLAVSPRTPYNRYPIPFLPVSAEVPSAGFEGVLTATLDPELGYHQGAVIDGLSADDAVTVALDGAAGLARHEGYETAFLETGSVELSDGS